MKIPVLTGLAVVAFFVGCAVQSQPECPRHASACDATWLREIRTATATDTAIGAIDDHYTGYGRYDHYYRRRADSAYVHVSGDVTIRELR